MVSGAETLLRWRRTSGEDWPPAIFIPEAERRGLMEPITIWTFDAVARAAAELSAIGYRLSAQSASISLRQC